MPHLTLLRPLWRTARHRDAHLEFGAAFHADLFGSDRRGSLPFGVTQSGSFERGADGTAPGVHSGIAMSVGEDGNTKTLPSGLVTFVFTDIEASTRLYKTLGEEVAYGVFEKHNFLLRQAWERPGGHEIHTEGDSFFVVFEDPEPAVQACIDAQRQLASASWPALAVHQAARVMSAANGGQILLTDSLVRRIEPSDALVTKRLGAFRLRDFDDAPTLHLVAGPDLEADERAVRATPANHHNLVPRLTSFVGRSADVVAVNGLLHHGTAVSLVGPGGMGKTRLATEVGLEVAEAWDDGVWMVELAEVVDPELVAEEIAVSIGVDSSSAGDRLEDVLEYIAERSMLIVLDNAEHVIAECARVVPALLRASAASAILTTSREPLNCQGEVVYRVQPLELALDVGHPTELAAVELFIDRARAAAVDIEWTEEAVADVLEICRHLDGLPLAIEIAAAQVGVIQLAEIRSGLDNRFRLLRSRDRALPDRQRTMEGLLGWSYRLLTDVEQRAFRRLAIFGGSFSIDAAEAALAGDGIEVDDVTELIWNLVDKSLIAADLSDSATRYRLLETVQQYALRLLIDGDDPVRSAVGLGEHLLACMAPWQTTDRRWLGHVAIELANVRSVVELAGEVEPELAYQLMCSVGRYYDTIQSYQTGIDDLERVAGLLEAPTPSRVALLAEIAHLHLRKGQQEMAARWVAQAVELANEVGPASWDDVAIQRVQGELALRSHDYEAAIAVAQATLDTSPSPQGAARMWSLIGIAQCTTGELAEGLVSLERALDAYVALGDEPQIALAHANVAEAAWRQQHFEIAAQHQRFSLQHALAIGQPLAIAVSLTMAGHMAAHQAQMRDAVLLMSSATMMLNEAGHRLYDEEATAMAETLALAERELGSEAVAQAQREGREFTALKAAELAYGTFDAAVGVGAAPCAQELH